MPEVVLVEIPLPAAGRARRWKALSLARFSAGAVRDHAPVVVALGDAAIERLAPDAVRVAVRGVCARLVAIPATVSVELLVPWVRGLDVECISPHRLVDRLVDLASRPIRPVIAPSQVISQLPERDDRAPATGPDRRHRARSSPCRSSRPADERGNVAQAELSTAGPPPASPMPSA